MPLKVSDLRKQYKALLAERQYIEPIWRELTKNFLPLTRVMLNDNQYLPAEVYQRIGEVNKSILDSTPIKAIRVLGAGMQSGMTSPAKIWFKLGHNNQEIEKIPSVKNWLDEAQNRIFNVMARSNFYNSVHLCYLEAGVIGTLVIILLEDDKKIIRAISLLAGSYVLASDSKGEIDTLYRMYFMTASQMVEQFGIDNVSMIVRTAYGDEATKGNWFPVIHCLKPNPDYVPGKETFERMKYASVYFEESPTEERQNELVLKRGGFREKPFVAARWEIVGDCVYGESPAVDILAFAKQLQAMTSTTLKGKQKKSDPPLNVPPGMKSASTMPGALNRLANAQQQLVPTIANIGDTKETDLTILDIRQQILQGLFNDIFRALALSPSDKMTATEVIERVSEGLRQLGPVLERLQFEFLDPMIDRIFAILERGGFFPPIPIELEGEELEVEYISPLAQAQKAVGTDALTKIFQFVGALAQLNPAVIDNVDFDEMLNVYAELIGVSPKVIRDSEEVAEIRNLRVQQQAAMAAQEREDREIANLKTMSETKVTPDANAIQSVAAATEAGAI